MRAATFVFNGVEYAYATSLYKNTQRNMRSVEVPLGQAFVGRYDAQTILEVGNVLSHHGKASWTTVDLREGPIKANVMAWKPRLLFDAIVSISTLEHIGQRKYGTESYEPAGIVDRLRKWLNPGGCLFATIPLRYAHLWDEAILHETLGGRADFMLRVNDANEWQQCDKERAFAADPRRWKWGAAFAVLQWTQGFTRELT